MKPREWQRKVRAIAAEHGAVVENRGDKIVLRLPNGGSVWCSSTPSSPAPDKIRRDIRRETAKARRAR